MPPRRRRFLGEPRRRGVAFTGTRPPSERTDRTDVVTARPVVPVGELPTKPDAFQQCQLDHMEKGTTER